jgi:hypothetical protein
MRDRIDYEIEKKKENVSPVPNDFITKKRKKKVCK